MRRSTLPALALSLVVLAGCSSKEAPSGSAGPVTEGPKNSEGLPPQQDGPVASKQDPAVSNPNPIPDKPGQEKVKTATPPDDPKKLVDEFNHAFNATKSALDISPAGQGGWRPVSAKADAVAVESEKKLASIRNVSGEANTQVEIGDSKGLNQSWVAIQNPGQFYVEYLHIQTQPRPDIRKQILVGDGTSYATNAIDTSGWSSPRPLKLLKSESQLGLDEWMLRFPREIFSALQGGRPFSALVAAGQKEGLNVATEEVFKISGDRQVRQHRILLSRKPEDVSKKGALTYEVIIDTFRKLPVTIRVNSLPPKGRPVKIQWTMRWNLDPNQKLAKDSFKIPNQPKAAQRFAEGSKL